MKRTARLASLALVGTLAFTACGNDDGDDTKASSGDPADGTSQTTGDGSEEPTDEETTDELEEGDEVDVDQFVDDMVEGTESMTTARMDMDMDLGGQKMTGAGDLSYEDGYKADISMEVPGAGAMRMIMIDSIIYMKMPQMGGKFVKMDLSDPNGPMGDMSQLMSSVDPAKQLESLEEGITRVVYEGDDEVQGEEMGHYVITVDPSRVKQFKDVPGAADLGELEYDAWFDGEHRLRQMEMDMPEAAGGGDMKVEVTDLGKDVDIKAPPAAQVTTLPNM